MPEIENWIRLAKLEVPKSTVLLVDHFGTPEELFQASAEEMAQVDGVTLRTAKRVRAIAGQPVDKEIEALEKLDARVVSYRDSEYPVNLRQISDMPVALFVRGELREEDRFGVGIVGTRRPTEYGRSMAMKLSRDLAERGLCVISGGARGIDTVVHNAAIQKGRTVAVLGSGLDVPYPYENRKLFDSIAETGAVISEFIPGTKPDGWRFPVRNRLVSGLSLGVLVVESMTNGGAMITATIAAEQGRDVWAIPGSADNPASEGPHRLIKEGAKLVEKADDILAELGLEVQTTPREKPSIPANLPPDQKAVLQILTLQPKHMDEIIAECSLSPATAGSTLTLLEMLGLVRRVPGNAYVRSV